jgi:predicted DNA-binding transcriptional regulator AlpA
MSVQLVRFSDLQAMGVFYSESRLRQLEKLGRFPKRKMLSPRKPVWLRSEVENWINTALGA